MKSSMKKLAVFGMIASVAMFIGAATASAFDRDDHQKGIHGEYAFTGSGACTLSPLGFNPNFTPVVPTIASMGPNVWEGVYTFNYNGKGKMEARQCYQNGPNTYDSGCALLSWEFKYEMDGTEITFTFIPRTYSLEYIAGPNTIYPKLTPPTLTVFDQPWTGRISPDGKNLSVFYGGPFKIEIKDFGIEVICNTVHQGFQTH